MAREARLKFVDFSEPSSGIVTLPPFTPILLTTTPVELASVTLQGSNSNDRQVVMGSIGTQLVVTAQAAASATGQFSVLYTLTRNGVTVYEFTDGGATPPTAAAVGAISIASVTSSFQHAETGNSGTLTYRLFAQLTFKAGQGDSSPVASIPGPLTLIGMVIDKNEV
ncbi:hypothetical protein [Paenibacillus hexagrammi]|uniref:Exosporium protein C n=1 Tax=Paenibacillus hexagrammi TaxID=2908839 RepID=A0ABY3SFS2_9BACL|nr:hypothetical protein [Paenibacillus sp. YPD9-1]UJF32094.1 hypothetical protein L0M14_20500 [Paenibacillus sp. YPD9-1]